MSHPDLAGRAVGGPNFVNDGRPSTSDCTGLGTALAGIVGGTQYGVAKKITVVSVRDTDCNSLFTLENAVSGIDWVVGHAVPPAVVMETILDYCVDPTTFLPVPCARDVAATLIEIQEAAFAAGLPIIGMAGDSARDTCASATGAAPHTIYVGATTSTDARAASSNFGPCVTMYAPGDAVPTDAPGGGTLMWTSSAAGAAYVAGTAALFAGKPEFVGASPTQIRAELVTNRSTPNVVTGLTPNSANRLLFTGPPGVFTTGDSASLAAAQDGRLALFGANKDGLLFHREQPSPGSTSWSPWTRSATKGWLSVGAEPNADGRLALLGVTPSGELWARQEATPNSNRYYNWTRLSTVTSSGLSVGPLGRVSMAYNRSNRLEIFATNQLGQAFYRYQLAPGSRQWTAWILFSFSGRLRSIAVTTYTDGRIEVLGVDDAGRVWRTTQNTPTDNNWLPFSQLGGFGATAIAAARNADGRLELFAVDAGGGAWHRQQTAVGTWGGTWVPLSPRTLSRMTAETDAAGRVHLVGVDNLGVIWQSVQTSANANTYSPWTQLDGRLRP